MESKKANINGIGKKTTVHMYPLKMVAVLAGFFT